MQTDGTGRTRRVVMGPVMFTVMTLAPVGINWKRHAKQEAQFPTLPIFYEDGI